MKVLLVIASTLAVAFGVYAPYQHYPLIGPGGHPVETPEVQAAKAHHFAAHAQAIHRSPYAHAVVPIAHAYGIPAVAHNGLPLDTPEVAAAKVQHYHDYNVAAQRNGVVGHLIPAGLGYHAGAPVDTPEVQLAKAAHFAAHAQAASRAHGHYRRRRSAYYPQHIPVIDAKGVPVETPEVQAAKAHHFAEYAKVASRAHLGGYIPQVHAASVYHATAPVNHFVHGPVGYHGPYAEIGHDGRPIETPEVQHATAAHLAAHAAVRSHAHY